MQLLLLEFFFYIHVHLHRVHDYVHLLNKQVPLHISVKWIYSKNFINSTYTTVLSLGPSMREFPVRQSHWDSWWYSLLPDFWKNRLPCLSSMILSLLSTREETFSDSWRARDWRRVGSVRCITTVRVGSSREAWKKPHRHH